MNAGVIAQFVVPHPALSAVADAGRGGSRVGISNTSSRSLGECELVVGGRVLLLAKVPHCGLGQPRESIQHHMVLVYLYIYKYFSVCILCIGTYSNSTCMHACLRTYVLACIQKHVRSYMLTHIHIKTILWVWLSDEPNSMVSDDHCCPI